MGATTRGPLGYRGRWLIAAAVALPLVWAFARLYSLRVSNGDLYPAYSSLRTDALGTKVLADALGELPGYVVDRDYQETARLGSDPRLMLLLGQSWMHWNLAPGNEEWATLVAAMRNGARVVVGFEAARYQDHFLAGSADSGNEPTAKGKTGESPKEAAPPKDAAKDSPAPGPRVNSKAGAKGEATTLAARLGVSFTTHWANANDPTAWRMQGAPAQLPRKLTCGSELGIDPEKGQPWVILYARAGHAAVLERHFGAGSLVLLADCFPLSNEAMENDRSASFLAWLVGDRHDIVFSEGALGLVRTEGVGGLMRRYGLWGAEAMVVVLGGLFAWRRLVPFRLVPRAGAEVTLLDGYAPTAGLTGLVRRSLAGADVLQECRREWEGSAVARRTSQAARARFEAAWAAAFGRPIVQAYNALVDSLRRR